MDLYLERQRLDAELQSDPNFKSKLPQQFYKMLQLDDLYSRFDGTGAGHQSAQSLDQSYYTALHVDDLRKRDDDQVVLKWFRSQQLRNSKAGEKEGMVWSSFSTATFCPLLLSSHR